MNTSEIKTFSKAKFRMVEERIFYEHSENVLQKVEHIPPLRDYFGRERRKKYLMKLESGSWTPLRIYTRRLRTSLLEEILFEV